MKEIEKQLTEINYHIDDGELDEACVTFLDLIKKLEANNHKDLPKYYYDFGRLLFDASFYDDSVKYLSKAYDANLKKQEIKDLIFNAFITPNEEEFVNNFNSSKKYFSEDYSYTDLPFEFIPISDYKYYIFDLVNDSFSKYIDFSTEQIDTNHNKLNNILIYDDYLLTYPQLFIEQYVSTQIYIITNDPLNIISFSKLPNLSRGFLENVNIFSSIDTFKTYLHTNSDKPLPQQILSLDTKSDLVSQYNQIINSEFNYRISKEGRNDSKILLSILLINTNTDLTLKSLHKLLNLPYTFEIQFIIIDNSKDDNSLKDDILKLNDSRILYASINNNGNTFFGLSLSKGLEISQGNFTLIIQSGDMINEDNLFYYMYILQSKNDLGIIRTSTLPSYSIAENKLNEKGENNFLDFQLYNGNISGIIYNTNFIKKLDIPKLLYNSVENNNVFSIIYPQMFIDAYMTLNSPLLYCHKVLCIENNISISLENKTPLCGDLNEELSYSSYTSRIEQHHGYTKILKELPLSCETLIKSYLILCWKTLFLVSLVNDKYNAAHYNLDEIYNKLYACCLDDLEFFISKSQVEEFDFYKNQIDAFVKNFKS